MKFPLLPAAQGAAAAAAGDAARPSSAGAVVVTTQDGVWFPLFPATAAVSDPGVVDVTALAGEGRKRRRKPCTNETGPGVAAAAAGTAEDGGAAVATAGSGTLAAVAGSSWAAVVALDAADARGEGCRA